jgi:hypothetical protein
MKYISRIGKPSISLETAARIPTSRNSSRFRNYQLRPAMTASFSIMHVFHLQKKQTAPPKAAVA